MSAILLGIHYEEQYSFQEASKINKSLEFENKPDFCCLENAFQNPGPKCNITALSLKTMNFFPSTYSPCKATFYIIGSFNSFCCASSMPKRTITSWKQVQLQYYTTIRMLEQQCKEINADGSCVAL